MRVARSIADARRHLALARSANRTVGLVPTMGAFHAGHVALMQAARAACDQVVVSLFVNPAQFDDPADFRGYPRLEAEDLEIAREAGADIVFAPSPAGMYPAGFATTVHVAGLSDVLEGEHRPGHFDGVCTVVTKLLAIVAPDAAFFGQKDAQQVAVVRRMVADLNLPVRIEALPTVREPDGLAMSSRNRRLTPAQRPVALALPRVLDFCRRAIGDGERDPAEIRRSALEQAGGGIPFDYLAIVDPDTLSPVPRIQATVLVAAAARVGDVRLIDNVLASPPPVPAGTSAGTSPQEAA